MATQETTKKKSDSSIKCGICLDDINNSEIPETSCQHSFHTQCLQRWCWKSTTCPQCRKKNFVSNNNEFMVNVIRFWEKGMRDPDASILPIFEKHCNRLLKENKNDFDAWIVKGMIEQHYIGNFTQAEKYYQKALLINPDNAPANHLLGCVYFNVPGPIRKRSVKYFEKGVSLGYAPSATTLSQYYAPTMQECMEAFHSGMKEMPLREKVIYYSEKAYQLDPENTCASFNYAQILCRQNNLEEATKLFASIVKKDPNLESHEAKLAQRRLNEFDEDAIIPNDQVHKT